MSIVGSALNNRYRLERLIGEGGFAHVYLATDMELGRQVAIKVLDQNWIRDQDMLNRFRNEARAVAPLEHPHILAIYDFGVDKGVPYLVMPYISGGTLATRMKEGPFTLDEIRFYLDQMGSALDYAHSFGIVHRDVKPSNFLIRPNGQLVLMDFGLAKLLNNAEFALQSMIAGTVAYLAPEQYRGVVTPASDIYMVGIILYEMLAGKLPYEGNTARILDAHMHATPRSLMEQPRMQSVPPAVVRALDEVVARALAKLPVERYQTCQALCYAYNKALEAAPDKPGKYSSQEKGLEVRNLDRTLITDERLVSPSATGEHAKGTGATPVNKAKEKRAPAVNVEATQVEPLLPPNPIPVSPSQPSSSKEAEDMVVEQPVVPRKKKLLEPARLIVTTEPAGKFQAAFDLTGEKLTLGRAKDNTLVIPLPIISRYHAVLEQLGDESQGEMSYKIVQNKSINPLRINGERIGEKVLEKGDIIEIGDRGYAEYIVRLTYHGPEYSFF